MNFLLHSPSHGMDASGGEYGVFDPPPPGWVQCRNLSESFAQNCSGPSTHWIIITTQSLGETVISYLFMLSWVGLHDTSVILSGELSVSVVIFALWIAIVLYCIHPILYSSSHCMSLSEALSITAIDTVSEFT